MMHKKMQSKKSPTFIHVAPYAKRIADISNKLKPKISFPVFDAIKSAYTIAKIEPVNSQTLIIFFLNI